MLGAGTDCGDDPIIVDQGCPVLHFVFLLGELPGLCLGANIHCVAGARKATGPGASGPATTSHRRLIGCDTAQSLSRGGQRHGSVGRSQSEVAVVQRFTRMRSNDSSAAYSSRQARSSRSRASQSMARRSTSWASVSISPVQQPTRRA